MVWGLVSGLTKCKDSWCTRWGESKEKPSTQINLSTPGRRSAQSYIINTHTETSASVLNCTRSKRLRGTCGDLQIAIARRARPSGIWNPNRVNEHLRVPHRKKVQTNVYTEVPCKKNIRLWGTLKWSWAESNVVQEKLCKSKCNQRNTTSRGFNGVFEPLNKWFSDLTPLESRHEPRQVLNKSDLWEPLFQTERSVSKMKESSVASWFNNSSPVHKVNARLSAYHILGFLFSSVNTGR